MLDVGCSISRGEKRDGRWTTGLQGRAPVLEVKRSLPAPKLAPLSRVPRITRVTIPDPCEVSRVLVDVANENDGRRPLTDRQRMILDFIALETRRLGKMPTLRSIGERFGIRSTNGVHDHVRALIRKGWLGAEPAPSAWTFSVQ